MDKNLSNSISGWRDRITLGLVETESMLAPEATQTITTLDLFVIKREHN